MKFRMGGGHGLAMVAISIFMLMIWQPGGCSTPPDQKGRSLQQAVVDYIDRINPVFGRKWDQTNF